MIKDKEYPATHSMTTAWYAIDDAGEVAIIDFDENGPVPQMVPGEYSPLYLLLDQMSIMVDGIKSANFSDIQADCIIRTLSDITDDVNITDLHRELIFTIPPQKTQRLLEILSEKENLEEDWNGSWDDGLELICLNASKGLWYADMFLFKEDGIRKLLEEKVLLKYRVADLSDIREDSAFSYDHDWAGMPIYLYKQSYWSYDHAEERVHKPEHPFRKDRLTKGIAGNALRIPGRFADMDELQIALYAPFATHLSENFAAHEVCRLPLPHNEGEVIVRTQTIPEIICGETCKLCRWKEMFPHYDFEKLCAIRTSRSIQCSDNPTLLWIGRVGMHMYLPSEPFWPMMRRSDWMLRKSCFVPLLYGEPRDLPPQQWQSAYDSIFANCKSNLSTVVDFLRPYAVIAYEECLPLIAQQFRVAEGKLSVNGGEYPLYVVERLIEEDGKPLEQYRDMPYRGTVVNRVISTIYSEDALDSGDYD